MDPFAFPPLAALLDLAYTALLGLTALLAPLAGPSAAALAIVLVTLVVRAALIPAGIAQAKAEQVRARLAPKLRDLQKRYRTSPERLHRETARLYRDENASPFAGCLPVLLQAPVVGVLYALFLHATIAGHTNALLDETLLGVPLGTSLAGSMGAGALDLPTAAVLGAVVLGIALVGEVSRRAFRMPRSAPGDPAAPADSRASSHTPAPTIPTGLLGSLQFATAAVAVFVPLAAGLYLLVTVTWTLVQRIVLRRRYPLPSDRSRG